MIGAGQYWLDVLAPERSVSYITGGPNEIHKRQVWPNQIGGHLYASPPAQKRSWQGAFACVRERPELPGCGLHFVDPEGVVLLVAIAVELDSSILLRCPHVEGTEATIDKRENVVNARTNAAIRSAPLTTCPPEN
jgi:hypothetical protein